VKGRGCVHRAFTAVLYPASVPGACMAAVLCGLILVTPGAPGPRTEVCVPTRPDALGPFYRPGAPVRTSVGKGYVLSGRVLAAARCLPVPGARLEFWLAGPDGRYGDAYRATVFADAGGGYRFESHFPPAYGGRPPHIHLRVSAVGYRTLVTQHYPRPGDPEGWFDVVLEPES